MKTNLLLKMVGLVLTMTLLGVLTDPVQAIEYTITDLGEGTGYANGINASGQVVGEAYFPGDSGWHAFFFTNGVMQNLGTLGGTYSEANSINNKGQVVGYSYIPGDSGYRAFLYSGGVMQNLGTLGGTWRSEATAINDNGQVVGSSYLPGNSIQHAFLYSDGVMQDLGTLGGTASWATGINASGQVVGTATRKDGLAHAFLYSGGVMQDIGTLGNNSSAYGINDSGQVVGSSYLPGNSAQHAFLYSYGVMHDLGTLGGTKSEAYGVNASGQVVGYSYLNGNPNPYPFHAFLYSDGVMADLNTLLPAGSGWVLQNAQAINDSGQIVGWGVNPLHQMRAFLLTPAVLSVQIDVKPGDDENSINLGSKGVIPVAILSDESFDATTVDPATVMLAGAKVATQGKKGKFQASQEDVDGDGLLDTILHFKTEELQIDPDATEVTLTGQTYSGEAIVGSDNITIVSTN